MSTLCLVAVVLNLAAVILLYGVVREMPMQNSLPWIPGCVFLSLGVANILIALAMTWLRHRHQWDASPEVESILRHLLWGVPMVGLCYALFMFIRVIPSPHIP